MKFRYYVTDLFDGTIKGVTNEEDAMNYAECEDFFVVDVELGQQLLPEGERCDVEPFPEIRRG